MFKNGDIVRFKPDLTEGEVEWFLADFLFHDYTPEDAVIAAEDGVEFTVLYKLEGHYNTPRYRVGRADSYWTGTVPEDWLVRPKANDVSLEVDDE